MTAYEDAQRNLAHNVRRLIAASGWPVRNLAMIIKVDRKALYRIVKGSEGTRVRTVAGIAEGFCISACDLLAPHDDEWAEEVVAALPFRKKRVHIKGVARAVIRSDGKRYASIAEAARAMYGTPKNIRYACKEQRRTAYGYGWRYESEEIA